MSLVNNVQSLMKDMLTLKESTGSRISQLEAEVENLKTENQRLDSELQKTKEKGGNFSTLVASFQTSLSNVSSLVSVNINKTLDELMAEVKQFKQDQLQLSSTMSSLEVLRMNLTNNLTGKSKKVGFSASVTSSSSSWYSGTLVFPSIITNEGNGYNPSNGIFTAPTAGMYVFFVNVQSYNSNNIYVDIVLNGSTKVRTMAGSSSLDYYDAGPNMVVLTIQKGDTVWVRHYRGSGYYTDGPLTTFSGFLL